MNEIMLVILQFTQVFAKGKLMLLKATKYQESFDYFFRRLPFEFKKVFLKPDYSKQRDQNLLPNDKPSQGTNPYLLMTGARLTRHMILFAVCCR